MTNKKRKTKRRTKRRTKKIGGGVMGMIKSAATNQIKQATNATSGKNPLIGAAGGMAMPTLPGGMPTLPGGMPTLPGGMPSLPSGIPSLPSGMPALPGVTMPNLNNMPMPKLTTGVNGLTSTLTKSVLPNTTLKSSPQLTKALSKSGLADSSGMLSTLKIFKAYPMGSLLIKTVMKSYENVMLFQHILKSKKLRNNKYKKQITELTPEQKQDFDIACCLIKKFYIKDIAKNYSYFRETDYITENCKVVRYIKSQIKLFNSIATKYQKNFTEVFSNNITKFANIQNNIGTKTIDEMQQEIEDAFTIGKNNYSYIILFLLHDISNEKIIVGPNCEYTYKEEKCVLEETVNAMFT